MLKSLMARLFKFKKPEYVDIEQIIHVKKPVNVKKAFATIRTKNGEDIICREFYGYVSSYSTPKELIIISAKQRLLEFFASNSINSGLILVKNDRMIRGTDILDIVGIVESDHIAELEVPEIQTVKILK